MCGKDHSDHRNDNDDRSQAKLKQTTLMPYGLSIAIRVAHLSGTERLGQWGELG
jgi:hypothetical protein